MEKVKRNLTVAAVIFVLAAIAVYQNFAAADQAALSKEEAPKVDFLAPSFEAKASDGHVYKVGGARDKALFINFWASWCGPCEVEAPHLQENYEKYKDRLDLYAVNATTLDKMNEAEAFAKRFGFTFPIIYDKDGSIVKLYQVYGYPTSFLVDKNGIIRDAIYGIVSPAELERKIKRLLQ